MIDAINDFLAKLTTEDGLASNTISAYSKDLELFAKFLIPKNIKISDVSTDDLRDYLEYLHKDKIRTSSVRRKLSALKSFYRFLEEEAVIKNSPVTSLFIPKNDLKLPKVLSESQILKLLATAESDQTISGIKLSCMLEILYASGMRVSELVALSYLQFQNNEIKNYLLIQGKGSKERIVGLSKAAISKLSCYLKQIAATSPKSSKWLFPGRNETKHLTRQGFHKMLKDLANKAGIDPSLVHPHVIRHSFASHFLNKGADLRVLQELLGHSDISTTQIYTHLLDSKLKDLVFKHHPLKNI